MRASSSPSPSSLARKSRLSTLPKDVLVEVLHTVSEEYEGKLKKQKEDTEQMLHSIREDLGMTVWKCCKDGCNVVFNEFYERSRRLDWQPFNHDGDAVWCQGFCNNPMDIYCNAHSSADKWYLVAPVCDIIRDMSSEQMDEFPERIEMCRLCSDCIHKVAAKHAADLTNPCSCVVTHNGTVVRLDEMK
jgi:hypothetical protein